MPSAAGAQPHLVALEVPAACEGRHESESGLGHGLP